MDLTGLLAIAFGAVLTDNLVFSRFLGVTPLFGASGKMHTAVAAGLTATFAMGGASVLLYPIERWLLAAETGIFGADLTVLRLPISLLVLTALVQLAGRFLQNRFVAFNREECSLLTMDCAALGTVLLNAQRHYGFLPSLVGALAGGIGFLLALMLFASLRERLQFCDSPKSFEGAPIALITAGLTALAFMGLTGVRIWSV